MRIKKHPKAEARACEGFTMVELVFTFAIVAILMSLAVSNFSGQVQQERARNAADAFLRQVGNARILAAQRGTRVQFDFNAAGALNTSTWRDERNLANHCGNKAIWATSIANPTPTVAGGRTVLSCLSLADFNSRYPNTVMTDPTTPATPPTGSIQYLPTGIANNNIAALAVSFEQGTQTTTIVIEPGGTAHVQK